MEQAAAAAWGVRATAARLRSRTPKPA